MHAYNKSYLPDVMDTLGLLFEYGTQSLGYDITQWHSMLISSGLACYIETGHPRFIAGMSAREMSIMLCGKSPAQDYEVRYGAQYWTGWALAALQWHTGLSFAYIQMHGLPVERILQMYNPYHEADISKFLADAEALVTDLGDLPDLKALRKASGLTQEELSARSGVPLRTIRSYEQGTRSLASADFRTVRLLSRARGI